MLRVNLAKDDAKRLGKNLGDKVNLSYAGEDRQDIEAIIWRLVRILDDKYRFPPATAHMYSQFSVDRDAENGEFTIDADDDICKAIDQVLKGEAKAPYIRRLER